MPSAFFVPSPMKKHELKLRISTIDRLPSGLLSLTLVRADGCDMPMMLPGQFVEVCIDRAKVLLNRPISVYNRTARSLELLVAPVGRATKVLAQYSPGDELKVIGPLGHGFTGGFASGSHILLVGGGVGIAPLYYQAAELSKAGCRVDVIMGSRTAPDRAIVERFAALGTTHICTDDGTEGFHGFVTAHPAWNGDYDFVQICGPKPMMMACQRIMKEKSLKGEASLENMMACGLGACLCCVEKTTDGNLCVCKEGPVFNIDKLW